MLIAALLVNSIQERAPRPPAPHQPRLVQGVNPQLRGAWPQGCRLGQEATGHPTVLPGGQGLAVSPRATTRLCLPKSEHRLGWKTPASV